MSTKAQVKELDKNSQNYKGVILPEGVTLDMLRTNWDVCKQEYGPVRKRMILLDTVDSGRLWEELCKKFPQYQVAPDSNHVNYIKENILAGIYTVGKSASLIPKSPNDEAVVKAINLVLESIWDILGVAKYQQKAGERAALLNLGITQVGWNQDLVGGTQGSWYKGDVVFKNIDPLNYFRDPFSTSLEDAAYVIHFEDHNIVTLESNALYSERIKEYKSLKGGSTAEDLPSYKSQTATGVNKKDTGVRLTKHWIKVARSTMSDKEEQEKGGYAIHEIHTVNNEFVLHVTEDISINMYPFAELYCNEPGNKLIGVSEPDKILSSSIVTNILDSIIATHAFKAQRPPRLINANAGLNLRNFAKYGNDPDKVWIVNGNASDAIHYVQFPSLPTEITNQLERLDRQIKAMSGIDEKYTGKDTGSILTTGGIEAMLAQTTMRDTTKINLYEVYAKDMSRLLVKFLIQYADKRSYLVKNEANKDFKSIELNFPEISDDIQFEYALHISNHLPKNKMRMAQSADAIMEKSLQYQDPTGETPPLMEPEEWLSFQEFPQKDFMVERMKIQRQATKAQEVTEILSTFAGLLGQGIPPEEALELTVQALENPEGLEQMMQGLDPTSGQGGLGSVGNEATAEMGGFAGSAQARQSE